MELPFPIWHAINLEEWRIAEADDDDFIQENAFQRLSKPKGLTDYTLQAKKCVSFAFFFFILQRNRKKFYFQSWQTRAEFLKRCKGKRISFSLLLWSIVLGFLAKLCKWNRIFFKNFFLTQSTVSWGKGSALMRR